MQGCWRGGLLTALGICMAMPAIAQEAPTAGALQRQIEQELAPRAVPRAPQAPAAAPAASGGPAVKVERFAIEGATLIPEAELLKAVAGRVGQTLNFAQLQEAAQAVADAYRARGYFARAFLPAQDVSGGVIRIHVVEGRFGKINPKGAPARADADLVAAMVGSRLVSGQPYSDAVLERGLLLANDLPGIQADGVLKAGGTVGTSDLDLTVTDLSLLGGDLAVNTYGARATGHVQAMAGISLDDLSGIGDQLTIRGVGSAAQNDGSLGYGQLGYSLPLGTDGLRARLTGTYLHYDLGANFANLDASGVSETLSAALIYPVIRSTAASLWASASFSHGWFDDDAAGAALHRRRIDAGTFGLNGDASDALFGGGLTSYSFSATVGDLDLSGLAGDMAQDLAGPRAAGIYGKLSFDVSRSQALGPVWFLRAHLAGQWSDANLDSSEQFALGGPYGVRAYPVNEAMGDQGALLNLELHRQLTEGVFDGLDLFGFFDTGLVRQHARLWAGAGTLHDSYVLNGAGIGAGYRLDGFVLSGSVALPVGPNPGGPYGHNQDGSDTGLSGWISITKTF